MAADPIDNWMRAELAATLRPCRELPYGDRLAKRASDRAEQRVIEDRMAATEPLREIA